MAMAYVNSILLAFLALVFVVSTAQEFPTHDHLENNPEDSQTPNDQALEVGASEKFIEPPPEDAPQDVEEQAMRRPPIRHGSTIALQLLYDKRNFLGCAANPCVKAGCPGLYMDDNDWRKCFGEVFKIYRKRGSGNVRVGDLIAISYPRESGKWFGCAGRLCGKADCPGHSCKSGFSLPIKWSQCWGEVFQIYARGKPLGSRINSHDHIMLYYVRGRNWVGLVGRNPDKRTCPGKIRPPPSTKYDRCWGEVFELWVRLPSRRSG